MSNVGLRAQLVLSCRLMALRAATPLGALLGAGSAGAGVAKSKRMVISASADAAAPATIVKGASFIRPHLLTLAPYTPIEPFEVHFLCRCHSSFCNGQFVRGFRHFMSNFCYSFSVICSRKDMHLL